MGDDSDNATDRLKIQGFRARKAYQYGLAVCYPSEAGPCQFRLWSEPR